MQKICMSIDQPESSWVNWLTKYNIYVLFVLIKYDEKIPCSTRIGFKS